jgi:hypothetical protein
MIPAPSAMLSSPRPDRGQLFGPLGRQPGRDRHLDPVDRGQDGVHRPRRAGEHAGEQ